MTISCICDPTGITTFLHWIARVPAAGPGILAALVSGYVYTAPASDNPQNPAVIKIAAAATPGPIYEWNHPGANPNRATSERSIDALVQGGAMPAHVGMAFRERVVAGTPAEVREIPDGAMFRGMIFGNGEYVPNVRAATAAWPSGVSRRADVYTFFDPQTMQVWVLTKPHACDNFAVAVGLISCDCPPGQ